MSLLSKMDMGSSTLMAKMAEVRISRESADVLFNCHGKAIKAHSFILELRYFSFVSLTSHLKCFAMLWKSGQSFSRLP